jgi:ferritin-like protein
MEPTAVGPNRTGAAVASQDVQLMLEAVREFSPPKPISTRLIDMERQTYITEADSVGSVPPPQPTERRKAQGRASDSEAMSTFLDKLGERLAFERTGTRLYDALITKYLALENSGNAPAAPETTASSGRSEGNGASRSATGLEVLQKIRADELSHFHLLTRSIEGLGGDPTAQTPCADVTAAASMGLMQVITDPRTTFAQSLNTILTAELTDNAGWELLSELAGAAGAEDLVEQFSTALTTEAEHLATVRAWLESLLLNDAGSPAV